MERNSVRQARFLSTENQLQTLMLKGLSGDGVAYHAFLKMLSGHLRAFFRKRLYQRTDDVEDLVQETLLAIHNQRHTYQPDQPLTAWIHAIARYKLVDLLRAHSAREALHEPLDDEQWLLAEPEVEALEVKKDLDALLSGLPDRQRLPILYVKLEGLSVTETADRIGMSESAVKVGIHRGLKALAARIKGNK